MSSPPDPAYSQSDGTGFLSLAFKSLDFQLSCWQIMAFVCLGTCAFGISFFALWQVVRGLATNHISFLKINVRYRPKTGRNHRLSSIGVHSSALRLRMVTIPSTFFSTVEKRWVISSYLLLSLNLTRSSLQYGDVFTFVLFGRNITVALGSKGNDFVLGGKVTHVSAEEAYTVCTECLCRCKYIYKPLTESTLGFHNPGIWQGCRIRCPQ